MAAWLITTNLRFGRVVHWIQCAHNRAPFVLILTYASRHALTEEVDVPGSVPVLKRSEATPDVLILLRRWYSIFWCMHRAGYGLRGRFGPGNFVVYESSNNPQMDLRMTGSLHIVRFNSFCGRRGEAVVPPHLRAWLDWIGLPVDTSETSTSYGSTAV
jgi:hypothetical protein